VDFLIDYYLVLPNAKPITPPIMPAVMVSINKPVRKSSKSNAFDEYMKNFILVE